MTCSDLVQARGQYRSSARGSCAPEVCRFSLVCPSLLHTAVSWEQSQQLGALKHWSEDAVKEPSGNFAQPEKLAPKPKQKIKIPDEKRACVNPSDLPGIEQMSSSAVCWWAWEEVSSLSGGMGQVNVLEERRSLLVMPVALGLRSISPCKASGVLKESLTWLLHWLMHWRIGGQSETRRGAMLGPELSLTSGRINAGQVSSVALSSPRSGFSKPHMALSDSLQVMPASLTLLSPVQLGAALR